MSKRKADYEQMLTTIFSQLRLSSGEWSKVMEKSTQVMTAASDLTKDELALIRAYINADLQDFAHQYQQSQSSPFMLALNDTLWHHLLDITDKTQIEWQELFDDIEHQGCYQSGDVIGLGYLVCEECGHKVAYTHPTVIEACHHCHHDSFMRLPLNP
ncbi:MULTISPECIES: zinc ribbon-containing protein [unclassified Vibrio]|uniref:Zinc ribbon-containing protein n=1 Tax=Vibrio sp. HB236076 TaxID=3232307 RepID=A0AB39H937_9VIBR|nr:zinc ribbon-containing protein [Vibrio sp. HB161653]MDP5254217.1 zinc ribbon-containing protein [Vibrio sp. HB161653]